VREFDTTFIVQPEISEDAREATIARLKGVLERAGAVPLEVDDMGKRKLAYEIKRFQKGHYLSLFYADSGKAVTELERALRLDESILRFLTVRRADDVGDLDARKAKAVELEKVRHERAAERATREAEERAAREAARLAGEPVDEGSGEGDEDEEYGDRERSGPRGRDDDDEGDDRAPAGE
jgi:small subunit ribosomal protein S6